MQDNWQITPLFSTPLYQAYDSITPSILNYIKNLEYIDEIKVGNGACTKNQKVLDDCVELKKIVEQHLNYFVYTELSINKKYKLRHSCSWATKHLNGDNAHQHNHAHSIYSGVIYIQCNNDSGRIVFHNDTNHPTYITSNLMPVLNKYHILNSTEWSLQPQDGMIVLFPSTCVHSVEKNNSQQHRYCVAFNYWLDGEYGEFTNRLTL